MTLRLIVGTVETDNSGVFGGVMYSASSDDLVEPSAFDGDSFRFLYEMEVSKVICCVGFFPNTGACGNLRFCVNRGACGDLRFREGRDRGVDVK